MLRTHKSKVYAVIPTFNRADMLKECIDSLISQSTIIEKIVVINSGSTDGTHEMINKYNGNIHVIDGNENWWWADCMNEGIKHSLDNGADFVLAMNDDTYLDRRALEYLLETSAAFPECVIGSIVKDRNGSNKLINYGVGAKYTKYRWIPYKRIYGSVNGRDVYYTEGHSGRGVLFPASVYKKIGLYDTENFPHRGDRDFSLRTMKAGIGQCYDSGADVFLNFQTSYLSVEGKRFTFSDVKDALFYINGLYNIKFQYRFLHKHYPYTWPFWFVIWVLPVSIVCFFRMTPWWNSVKKLFRRD